MIRRYFDVRPGEARNSASGFITLFGIMAAHALLEVARDALFLAELPATRLPAIYVGIAVMSLAAVKLRQRSLLRFEWRSCLAFLLADFAILTVALWYFARDGATWALYALYAWPAMFATIVITAFWTFMGRLFTIAQAKRLFVPIGSGGILGAITGTALARLMVQTLPTPTLLLAAAALLLATAGVPRWGGGRETGGDVPPDARAGNAAAGLGTDLAVIRARPYVLRILLLITVTAATATVMDYLFKSRAVAAVPAADLPRFFSTFYLSLNLASLLVQLALVGWLVRVVGVVGAGMALPALLAVCSGWFLVGGSLLAVLAGRSADGALRHSLNRTANELLFVPLPGDLRDRFKAVADVVGQRGGQAGAALLLVLFTTLGLDHSYLAALAGMLALAWLGLAVDLRVHYLNVIRHVLDDHRQAGRVEVHALHDDALEMLVSRLRSDEPDEVTGALDVLLETGHARRVPASLLDHPETAVTLRTLAALAAAPDAAAAPRLEALLRHDDAAVRLGATQALVAARAGGACAGPAFDDDDAAVRAAALVGLAAASRLPAEDVRARVALLPLPEQARARLAAARAIRLAHRGGFGPWLRELAGDADREVALAAAEAMAQHPDTAHIPALLPLLADFRLRWAARRALVAIGPDALPHLERHLVDPAQPFEVRQHLPRTISRFEPGNAHELLLRHLGMRMDPAIAFKIVRGLGQLRAEHPHLPKPEGPVLAACEYMVLQIYRSHQWRLTLATLTGPGTPPRTAVGEMLADYLADQEQLAREWLLRILAMFYAPQDLKRIHSGIGRGDAATLAAGLELLGEYLPPRLRRPVAGLLEDLTPIERMKFAPTTLPPSPRDLTGLLGAMIEADDLHLRCLAVYHAGELGLDSLRRQLAELRSSHSSRLREVAGRALAMLDDPQIERLAS